LYVLSWHLIYHGTADILLRIGDSAFKCVIIAKELMAQWQGPLAGRLLPRVQTLGAAPKTSGVSLGVFLSKKCVIIIYIIFAIAYVKYKSM
jgi:hypothetical protein